MGSMRCRIILQSVIDDLRPREAPGELPASLWVEADLAAQEPIERVGQILHRGFGHEQAGSTVFHGLRRARQARGERGYAARCGLEIDDAKPLMAARRHA